MILDRELQRELMIKMAEVYPAGCDFMRGDYADINKVYANLYYLQSHGLLEPKSIHFTCSLDGYAQWSLGNCRLSHRGMDFLADDGGLSAILGVVTIKFETEQLKMILASKIMSSDLPLETKNSMIDALKEMPAEALKHLTTKIVDEGWDSLDTLMTILQNSFF